MRFTSLNAAEREKRTALIHRPIQAVSSLKGQNASLRSARISPIYSNQATQRFAGACPLSLPGPGLCPFGGACHGCPGSLQTKLKIGQPGDRYEQEADRVAEWVMRIPERNVKKPTAVPDRVQGGIGIQPLQTGCHSGPWGHPPGKEQRTEPWRTGETSSHIPPRIAAGPAGQTAGLRNEGRPLPESVRTFFEPRFGYNLSRVRIHTEAAASKTARSINARAYTYGRHIVFGDEQYAPHSAEGKRLLAHELAHVIQQNGDGHSSRMISKTGFSYLQRTSYADSCRRNQWPSLHAAVYKSRMEIARVRPRLVQQPLTQVVRDALWLAFRDDSEATAQRVHDNLGAIYAGLPGATIDCEQESDRLYRLVCRGDSQAYTWESPWGYTGNIHICMGQWAGLNEDQRSRIVTHEGAHLYVHASDAGGYFLTSGCAETGSTAASTSETRLNNADSYACIVHYLTSTIPGVLSQWRADLSGSTQLQIVQNPQGAIDLDSADTDSPTFEIQRSSTGRSFFNPVFSYRWIIADAADERYQMRNILGGLAFRYGPHDVTIISSRTRALLRSREIRSADILCRVRIPGVGSRLLRLRVRFTSASWGRST